MNVLVIGSGGREHALCWSIKKSPKLKRLYGAPGNGGIAALGECVNIPVDDIDGLLRFALQKKIDLTVVGPEASLTAGVVDAFTQKGLKIFGPSKAACQLEASKVFAKEFMGRWHIPTAGYQTFHAALDAQQFLQKATFPLVVKADGIAAGKGVYVCVGLEEAYQAIDEIMVQKIFKAAGDRVVIEECLQGAEVSVLAISDGRHFLVLPAAQDHKRIFDDDLGPNTGGMGSFSPHPLVTAVLLEKMIQSIIEPTIRGMYQEGCPFKGVLYVGLMLTQQGPKVLEFNARFGDPETQCLMPRLESDIMDILMASCDGRLQEIKVKWNKLSCVCVVIASGGYPASFQSGYPISGLDHIKNEDTCVFHAATRNDGGTLVTAGGRVLGISGLGINLEVAAQAAYNAVGKIRFEHMFFRRDIAAKALRGK